MNLHVPYSVLESCRRRRHLKGPQKKGTLEDYWLLHERLGHPDFHYMRKLYPNLGDSLDFS